MKNKKNVGGYNQNTIWTWGYYCQCNIINIANNWLLDI